MVVMYAVAHEDPQDAEEEVRARRAAPNENVEAVGPLALATRDRLGIRPGETWML